MPNLELPHHSQTWTFRLRIPSRPLISYLWPHKLVAVMMGGCLAALSGIFRGLLGGLAPERRGLISRGRILLVGLAGATAAVGWSAVMLLPSVVDITSTRRDARSSSLLVEPGSADAESTHAATPQAVVAESLAEPVVHAIAADAVFLNREEYHAQQRSRASLLDTPIRVDNRQYAVPPSGIVVPPPYSGCANGCNKAVDSHLRATTRHDRMPVAEPRRFESPSPGSAMSAAAGNGDTRGAWLSGTIETAAEPNALPATANVRSADLIRY